MDISFIADAESQLIQNLKGGGRPSILEQGKNPVEILFRYIT